MRLLARIGASGVLGAHVAVLGLLALGGVSMAQTAQPKAQAAPVQGAPRTAAPAAAPPVWAVNCMNTQAGLDCRAVESLRLDQSGRVTLTVAVRLPADTKKPTLLLLTPLGIYLPAGVTMQFGQDTAKAIPLRSCDTAGCLAEYPVSDAELTAMQSGADFTVTVQDLNKRAIKIPVPTAGFGVAYAKIK